MQFFSKKFELKTKLLLLTVLHVTSEKLKQKIKKYNYCLGDHETAVTQQVPMIREEKIPKETYYLYTYLSEIIDDAYNEGYKEWFRLNIAAINYHFKYYKSQIPEGFFVSHEIKKNNEGLIEIRKHINPKLIMRYGKKFREVMVNLRESLTEVINSFTEYARSLKSTLAELEKNPDLTELERNILSTLKTYNNFNCMALDSESDSSDDVNCSVIDYTLLSPLEKSLHDSIYNSSFLHNEEGHENSDHSDSPNLTPRNFIN